MKKSVSVSNPTVTTIPQSFITKSKQRLKQYDDTVYLNNGDQFEIELFNPSQNKILAEIELNGNKIGSSGIVLMPGQRVFLERYIDDAKKFLFETYSVNGNSQEVLNAIAKNGEVKISFYNEDVFPQQTYYYRSPVFGQNPTWTGTNLTSSGPSPNWNTITTTSFTTSANFFSADVDYGSSTHATTDSLMNDSSRKTKSLETGRVEKGGKSDQSFTHDYSNFNSYPSYTKIWKIMPQSTKLLTKEDLVVFCTECGSKRKKDNHKFCPHCGNKF